MDKLDSFMILGELSLDGSLQPMKGALPSRSKPTGKDLKGLFYQLQNAKRGSIVGKWKSMRGKYPAGDRFLNDTGKLQTG